MTNPSVTVLLNVYNGENYIRAAIISILNQSLTDFEFLIINDGSTDQTASILAEFADPRITVIHQKNIGIAETLNKGINLAKGRYIARLDHDDISHPKRLEKQFNYMEAHLDCALLGTHAEIWVENLPDNRQHLHPTDHAILCFELLFDNPFVQSSVMFRREMVQNIGGYCTDPSRQPPEDFELWSRISRTYQVANLPERLVTYREVGNSYTRTVDNTFNEKLILICADNILSLSPMNNITQHVQDVVALTHSVFYKLSREPNIKKMQEVVIHIGKVISEKYNNPEVMALAYKRAKILKYQFRKYQLYKLFPMSKNLHDKYRKIRKNVKCLIRKYFTNFLK